jgi:hypothetical protein
MREKKMNIMMNIQNMTIQLEEDPTFIMDTTKTSQEVMIEDQLIIQQDKEAKLTIQVLILNRKMI